MVDLIRRKFGSVVSVSRDEVKFRYRGMSVNFQNGKEQKDLIFVIKEQFFEEQYKWLRPKGEKVVDIGAYVGDSSIYFAVNGAKRVYAFEPYPHVYALAKKNISVNGLRDEIMLFNMGCGGKRSIIVVSPNRKSAGSSAIRSGGKGKHIRVVTLDDIVREHVKDSAVLKVDCEGCEYGLIIDAKTETLRKFKRIMIEYHQEGYGSMSRRLKDAGFRVRHTVPKKVVSDSGNSSVGIIFAELTGKVRNRWYQDLCPFC
jgi:FkbM family methyltransferase